MKAHEIKNKIDELKSFNVNGVSGKVSVQLDFGVTGVILFDQDGNNVPFSYENNEFTYHAQSLKYSPLSIDDIQKHIESIAFQIIYLNKQLNRHLITHY